MIKEQLNEETIIYYFKKIPTHVPAWMEKKYWKQPDYCIYQESNQDCFAISRETNSIIGDARINEWLDDDYPFRIIVLI